MGIWDHYVITLTGVSKIYTYTCSIDTVPIFVDLDTIVHKQVQCDVFYYLFFSGASESNLEITTQSTNHCTKKFSHSNC